jgi:hypothetical protein
MNLENFSTYYESYRWEGKHNLFGYPADSFPEFSWIKSLETRFDWLRSKGKETASIYLIKEMIEWGGSQNGVLQKFNDRCGEVNLYELIQTVIISLNDPREAIKTALDIPGLGLTYASKLLRFFNPESFGALDGRIRKALEKEGMLKNINDSSNSSMIDGYFEFLSIINNVKKDLEMQKIKKPICSLSDNGLWRASDIEMALFQWAYPIKKKKQETK